MNRWLLAIAGRVYVWALVRSIEVERAEDLEQRMEYEAPPWPRAEVRRLAWREISSIRESICKHFDYQDREQRILSERLSRRYDLGMALNEAANRAILEKQAILGVRPPPAPYPTEKQKLALKLQEETLKERLRNS